MPVKAASQEESSGPSASRLTTPAADPARGFLLIAPTNLKPARDLNEPSASTLHTFHSMTHRSSIWAVESAGCFSVYWARRSFAVLIMVGQNAIAFCWTAFTPPMPAVVMPLIACASAPARYSRIRQNTLLAFSPVP